MSNFRPVQGVSCLPGTGCRPPTTLNGIKRVWKMNKWMKNQNKEALSKNKTKSHLMIHQLVKPNCTFYMLTEARGVWDVDLVFFTISFEHFTDWPWDKLHGKSTPGQIGNCPECFSLVNNLSLCRMMDSKLFGNDLITLPRLVGGNNCFSKIITDVFSPRHCVNSHPNAPDRQITKSFLFIEVATLADDQLSGLD